MVGWRIGYRPTARAAGIREEKRIRRLDATGVGLGMVRCVMER
jgi:hypothetical protein